ncbi:MAG: flippase-like domain-containing protein [Kiritimatiellia bacterium]
MKNIRIWIKAAVSLLFFYVLFRTVSGRLITVIRGISPLYLAVSFAITAVIVLSSCLKWKVLVDLQAGPAPFGRLLRIYLIGYLFSGLLPSNVGGDVVRSYYAGRTMGSQSAAAVTVFIERFSGILVLLLLVIAAPLMSPDLYLSPFVYVTSALAAALLLLFLWIARMPEPFRGVDRILKGAVRMLEGGPGRRAARRLDGARQKLVTHGNSFRGKLGNAVGILASDKRALLRVTALTLLFYAVTWVNVHVAFRTFGVETDFLRTAALVPAAMLLSMIPVAALGNLGFTEGVYVVIFALAGFSPAESLAMGLLLRFKLLVLGIVGLAVYLTYGKERIQNSGSGGIQSRLRGGGSGALARYRETVVGRRGTLYLVKYELFTLLFSRFPGRCGVILRRMFYRFLLGRAGSGAVFGKGIALRRPAGISIGDGVTLGDNVSIDVKNEDSGVRLEDGVTVGRGTVINCIGGQVRIGAGTCIGEESRLGSLKGLEIGEGVVLGKRVYISGATHSFERTDIPVIAQPLVSKGADVIGSGARIGDNSTVLDGVKVGRRAEIGPGSLVNRNVEAGARVEGVPARPSGNAEAS